MEASCVYIHILSQTQKYIFLYLNSVAYCMLAMWIQAGPAVPIRPGGSSQAGWFSVTPWAVYAAYTFIFVCDTSTHHIHFTTRLHGPIPLLLLQVVGMSHSA